MFMAKTLHDWLPAGASLFNKRLTSYLNLKVVKEISSVGMDWYDYVQILHNEAPFKQKNIYSFCVLENGFAVGFNENEATGWTFPIVKYSGWYATGELKHGVKVKVELKDQIYECHIENRMIGEWPCKKEELFIIFDDTEMPHFPYPVRKWEGKIEVLDEMIYPTIQK
jgi:hypothetical protein